MKSKQSQFKQLWAVCLTIKHFLTFNNNIQEAREHGGSTAGSRLNISCEETRTIRVYIALPFSGWIVFIKIVGMI